MLPNRLFIDSTRHQLQPSRTYPAMTRDRIAGLAILDAESFADLIPVRPEIPPPSEKNSASRQSQHSGQPTTADLRRLMEDVIRVPLRRGVRMSVQEWDELLSRQRRTLKSSAAPAANRDRKNYKKVGSCGRVR